MSGYDGSITLSTNVDMSGIKAGIVSIKDGVTKLGAAIGIAFGVGQLVAFGKEAVSLASDLQEVQNVVDTSFGSLSYKMEEFAQTAIETYGISKLVAKQTGSTYMAMANGMGLANDVAADMSLKLTGLSADMASFYNVSQDVAATALSSVFTGETETLKKYGIVMTETNLAQFAMEQGIAKNISAMTQQEKTLLRYNYVMQQTSLTHGDFAKTSESWANQTRILSERWKEVKTTFGDVFMTLAQLVLPAVNNLISGLAVVAEYAKTAAINIAALFGKEVKKDTASIDNKSSSSADNVAAIGTNAETSAKKLKKLTAGFDELDILTSNSEAASNGSVGSMGNLSSDAGSISKFDATDTNSEIDTTWIDNLKNKIKPIAVLVASIGAGLLAWKISEILKNDIASLPGKFTQIVGVLMTIAGAVLLIEGYSDAWVNGLDWGNFASIMGGLALLIGGIALVISPAAAAFAAIGGAIALIVLGVKDFIENGASFQNILIIITGLAVLFAAALIAANLPIAVIVTAIAAVTAAFVILWNKSEGFKNFWITLWEKIKTAANTAWNEYIKPMFKAIGDFIVDIYKKYISPTIDFIKEKLLSLWSNHIKPLWQDRLYPLIKTLGDKINDLWTYVISPVINGIADAVKWLWEHILKPLLDFIIGVFVNGFKNAFTYICDTFATAIDWIGGCIESVLQILSGIIDFIVGAFTGDWERAWEGVKEVFAGIINGVISIFEGFVNFIIDGINLLIRSINTISFDVPDWVPVIGGETWGFNIPEIPRFEIPRLARGAVIPPNSEFLAVLGDQKHGTNIEAPLETIIEAFKTVSAERGSGRATTVILELDGRELGCAVVNAGNEETRRIGTRLVVT